jgi:hypothetical protein
VDETTVTPSKEPFNWKAEPPPFQLKLWLCRLQPDKARRELKRKLAMIRGPKSALITLLFGIFGRKEQRGRSA